MTMALLAFAGLFIFDQLATLKFKYMAPRDAYFERYIKKKTKIDQYCEGTIDLIVKSGTELFSWGNLVKYLSLAKLTPSTPSQGGHGYLLGNIQTKSNIHFFRSCYKFLRR